MSEATLTEGASASNRGALHSRNLRTESGANARIRTEDLLFTKQLLYH